MTGRQVIRTNRAFTLEELDRFLKEHWDKTQHSDFVLGRPVSSCDRRYVLLPATYRFMVVIYPLKERKLFGRGPGIVLSVFDTSEEARKEDYDVPVYDMPPQEEQKKKPVFNGRKTSKTPTLHEERKGAAEQALLGYAAYLKELLTAAGYTK